MQVTDGTTIVSATDLVGFLECDHLTTLEIGRLEGYSGTPGSGAVLRIEFENPADWKWALDTWRGVRPL